jgi:hypothetical protein
MNGTAFVKSAALKTPPSGWRGSAVGDLNNDGRADIIWRNSSGQVSVWLMDGTNLVSSQFLRNGNVVATNWHAVAVKDLNGDGHSDLIWHDDIGRSQVWLMNGTAFQSASLLRSGQSAGAGWKMVGAGRFNADTKTDLVWQHSDGRVAIWFMNGLTYTSTTVMSRSQGPGWKVVGVPDFNKDGKSDLLWRYLSPFYTPF